MELELSLMGGSDWVEPVRELLAGFEQPGSACVKLTYQGWDKAWAGLVRSSLHGNSPTVSEVGTSWVPDLVGMNALYPLPAALEHELGRRADFVPQSWDSCFLFGNPQLWAVPWISGTRLIYYRKDLFARAGLDPLEACASLENLLAGLARLEQAGVDYPWVTSTVATVNTLHLIASWVWAAGGDFVSQNGQKLLFAEPNALAAMALFFRMARYLGATQAEISYNQAIQRFWNGEAALTFDGSWLYPTRKASAAPRVLANLGFAPLPAPAFVGGSNLVVWTNTVDKEAALRLLRYLSQPRVVLAICGLTGLSPARLSLLNQTATGDRAFQAALSRAFATGRSLPNQLFSAMLEDKLQHALGDIWREVLAAPEADPLEILTRHLVALKERLERVINS